MMKRTHRREAAALVVCVGMLAVLSLLAVSFARNLRIEEDAARERGLALEADLTVRAGLERAAAGLVGLAAAASHDSIHDAWIYEPRQAVGPGGDLGPVAGALVPLDEADRPSFADRIVGGEWVSGEVPGDPAHPERVRTFRLKILDLASMIDLNGPRDVVALQLANLGKILTPRWGRIALAADQVEAILAWRDARGAFADRRELLSAGLVSEADYDGLASLVTAHARRDERTVRATSAYADGAVVAARVQPGLEISPRAPINLNTAGPEVLAANLGDAEGVWFEAHPTQAGVSIARRMRIPLETAIAVAQEIVASRALAAGATPWSGPFASREQFELFVDSLYQRQIVNRIQADMVKRLADPNAILSGHVGKAGLVRLGCEFAFASGGRFEIECRARVGDLEGRELASSWARTVLDLYAEWTDRTLADFLAGQASAPDPAILARSVLARSTERNATAVTHSEGGDPGSPTTDGGVRIARYVLAPPPEATLHVPFDGTLEPTVARGDGRPVLRTGVEPQDVTTSEGVHASRGSGVAYPMSGNFPMHQGTLSLTYRPDWQHNTGYQLYTLAEATVPTTSGGFYSYTLHVYNYCGVPYLVVTISDTPAVVFQAAYYLGPDFPASPDELQITVLWDLTPDPSGTLPSPTDQVQVYLNGRPSTAETMDVFQDCDFYQPDPEADGAAHPLPGCRCGDCSVVELEDAAAQPPLVHVGTSPSDEEVAPGLPARPDYRRNGLLSGLGDAYRDFRDRAVSSSWAGPTEPQSDTSLYWFIQWYLERTVSDPAEREAIIRRLYGRSAGTVRNYYGWNKWIWHWDLEASEGFPPLVAHAIALWHALRSGDTFGGHPALQSAEGFIRNLILLDRNMGGAWARAWYGAGNDSAYSDYYEGPILFRRALPSAATAGFHRFLGASWHQRWISSSANPMSITVRDALGVLGPGRAISGPVTWELTGARSAEGSPLLDDVTLRFSHEPRVIQYELLPDRFAQGEAGVDVVQLPVAEELPSAGDLALPEEVFAHLEGGHWNPYHEFPILPADLPALAGHGPGDAPRDGNAAGKAEILDQMGQGGGSSPRAYDPASPYAGDSAGFGPWSQPTQLPGSGVAGGGSAGVRGSRGGSRADGDPASAGDDAAKAPDAAPPGGPLVRGRSSGEEPEVGGLGGGSGGGKKSDDAAGGGYLGWLAVTLVGEDGAAAPRPSRIAIVDREKTELLLREREPGVWAPEGGVRAGKYELVVEADGFRPVARSIAVVDGKEKRVEIVLQVE